MRSAPPFWAAAEDSLLPSWFSALNKHGIPHHILGLITVLAVLPIILNASLEYAYAIQMAPGALFTVLEVAPALLAPKKRPEAFAKAWFKLPYGLTAAIAAINICIAAYFGYQLFQTLDMGTIIGVVVFFGAGITYYYWWKNQLAKRDIDLTAMMGLKE